MSMLHLQVLTNNYHILVNIYAQWENKGLIPELFSIQL